MIHLHSEHSINDGAMTIKEMVSRAKELGVTALALTDHGTCTGWVEFLKETKKQGIKGILGVEAYVSSDATDKRCHMILLAKNKKGYKEISKAVTLSNHNVDRSVPNYAFPIMNKEILKECFGNGNVIATSACVAGILSQILLYNYYIDKNIAKIQKNQKKYQSLEGNTEYQTILEGKEEKQKEIDILRARKKELEKLANKDYSKREVAAMTMFDMVREEVLNQIAVEKEESRKAKESLAPLEAQIKEETGYLDRFKKTISQIETKAKKYEECRKKIQELEDQKIDESILYEKTKKELQWYKDLFGEDFFIELQYHGIDMEKKVFPVLAELATDTNTPVVAANDAHMARRKDVSKREFLRSLRYNQWEKAQKSDAELYMKSDEELVKFLNKILPKDVTKEAINNVKTLCDRCEEIDLMNEDHYPKYIENGIMVDSPALLRKKANEGIKKLFPDGFSEKYQKRLEYELDVIIKMGFADYLLIVADYVNYGKKLAINNNPYHVGYGIGPARGSGAGSLVNYLIGITSIDPMKYDLLFERFLNAERVTMPDIDVDFSKEVREGCIAYVTEKYGQECVAAIRTKMTQAPKLSIHNAARLLGDKESHDKKKYMTLGNKIASKVPNAPYTNFNTEMDNGLTVQNNLLTVFNDNEAAKEIISMAVGTEGAMTGLGVHAAGIVIADGHPLYDYIPVCDMEESGMAVSCDMVEIEEIGCLKMDFLGLKNLDILSHAIRLIKKRTNKEIDLDHLPQDPEVYKNIFAKGNTDSVFQFESQGMKKMLREFKPDCFDDIILLVAAYRPGPMQYLSDIIKVKNGSKKPSYLCKELVEILGNTYAAIIYQEQVMSIFQKLAGYSLGGADIVRRYMSKKKMEPLKQEREIFIHGSVERNIPGCVKNGIDEKAASILFDNMIDFAKYAFNKSHAASYAMIAYQTAYLKYHYPKEYMSAVLSFTKFDKLFDLSLECKRMGLTLQAPDIQQSDYNFSPTEDGIRYGFVGIKGTSQIGKRIIKDRETVYSSFHDFFLRLKPKKNEAEALVLAGCFDSMYPKKRMELFRLIPELIEGYSKIEKKQTSIHRKEQKLLELNEAIELKKDKLPKLKKERTKTEESLAVYKKDLETLWNKWYSLDVLDVTDEPDVLEKERNVLGAYVSGHVLDHYQHIYTSDVTKFENFKNGKVTIAGVVRDVREYKGFKFFLIDDPTGTYHVNMYKTEKYGSLVKEGAVLKIFGKGSKEQTDEDTDKITVIPYKVTECEREGKKIYLSVQSESQFFSPEFQSFFGNFVDENGYSVKVVEMGKTTVRNLKAKINPIILETNIPFRGVTVAVGNSEDY